METVAVIDFETTGLSPAQGDRATEIAVVLLRDGEVVDRYHSLMNAGVRIPAFIESYTGISNAMIQRAPSADVVMAEAAAFVGDIPLIAHNASFDQKFWDAELARVGMHRSQPFACSMLVARRVFPDAPNHKLGELVAYAKLPVTGQFHRALADAEMTACLVTRLAEEIRRCYCVPQVPHALLRAIQTTPKHLVGQCVGRFSAKG